MVKPLAGLLAQLARAVKTEGKTARVWGPYVVRMDERIGL
jgi:hypothetical protein